MDLIVISGPMFAGKTTELLKRLRCYKIAERKVLLLKPLRDARYNNVTTHDGTSFDECLTVDNILSLTDDLILSNNVIGIDEGQFFKGIFEFINRYLDKDITFVIAGLTETFNSSILFEEMAMVFSIANSPIRLSAVCNECKKPNATYSYNKVIGRKPCDTDQLGGIDKYLALCRSCYFKK